MSERQCSTFGFVTVLLLVAAGAAGSAEANGFTIGEDGQTSSECDRSNATGDDCPPPRTGPNGDPTECPWPIGQTGADYMECIGGQYCDPDNGVNDGYAVGIEDDGHLPDMNFWLSEGPGCNPPGNPDPEDEIFSYCLWETGDAIGYARIEVEQPNLVAKIGNFIERPDPYGQIRIEINDDEVTIDVAYALGSADRLNKLVCSALGRDGRRVECLDRFFVVYSDSQGQAPTVLSLLTADTGISTTEIALEPIGGEPDITACSEPDEAQDSGPFVIISR